MPSITAMKSNFPGLSPSVGLEIRGSRAKGTIMTNYRAADSKTQWFQDNFPGSTMNIKPSNLVLVIHTTETTSWPGYEGGATAPNYTGLPPLGEPNEEGFRKGAYRAHF